MMARPAPALLAQRHEDVELLRALRRLDGANRRRRERAQKLEHRLRGIDVVQNLNKIARVERDGQILALLLDLEFFVSVAGNVGIRRHDEHLVRYREFHHARAIARDEFRAAQRADERGGVHRYRAIELRGNHQAVIGVLPVDQTHDDRSVAAREHQLIALWTERGELHGGGAPQITRRFGERSRRDDVLFRAGDTALERGLESGQAVAVRRDHRKRLSLDFEQRAHEHRAARFFAGSGEDRGVDAVAKPFAADAERLAPLRSRERGVFLRREGVKVVVAAFGFDAGARRRADEFEEARLEVAEITAEEFGRHGDAAAFADLGGKRVLQREFQIRGAHGDLSFLGAEQHVGEDRYGSVRVDYFTCGADRAGDIFRVTGELHGFPLRLSSVVALLKYHDLTVSVVRRCILRTTADSLVAARIFARHNL